MKIRGPEGKIFPVHYVPVGLNTNPAVAEPLRTSSSTWGGGVGCAALLFPGMEASTSKMQVG